MFRCIEAGRRYERVGSAFAPFVARPAISYGTTGVASETCGSRRPDVRSVDYFTDVMSDGLRAYRQRHRDRGAISVRYASAPVIRHHLNSHFLSAIDGYVDIACGTAISF